MFSYIPVGKYITFGRGRGLPYSRQGCPVCGALSNDVNRFQIGGDSVNLVLDYTNGAEIV